MKRRTARRATLTAASLLLTGAVLAQTNTVPFTGSGTLPDGSRVTINGTATIIPPAPPPPPPPPPVVTYGPRDPVGPDVPLTAAEVSAFSRRVTVAGFTAAAIQAACDSAKAQGIPTVFLPAGTYTLTTYVNVPGGLTILGAGSGTLLKPSTAYGQMLYTRGDNTRYTRLKMVGPAALQWLQGDREATARGIEAWSVQNVRVDHCDISGMAYATLFQNNASGQVDHNRLHHNQVIGYGYGVSVAAGANVAVVDNAFSDNRHSLASNGGGTRPSTWDFSHNSVTNLNPSIYQQAQVDTHAGFDGVFTVSSNDFSRLDTAVGLYNGAGTISGNRIEGCDQGVKIYTPAVHDVAITGTVMQTVRVPYSVVSGAPRITVDGRPMLAPGGKKPGAVRKKRR
jgi:hypothetical protein